MMILQAALAAILAIRGATVKAPSAAAQLAIVDSRGRELARTIKSDLEAISGTGTVNVSVDSGTLFTTGIAIRGFDPKICTRIYDHEMELRQLFPELKFDFYFDGPQLARAIQADLESIAGRGTVDVSADSKTLFTVRIALPGVSSEIYRQIFDRELEFYRAFRDLNFDFYLQPKAISGL